MSPPPVAAPPQPMGSADDEGDTAMGGVAAGRRPVSADATGGAPGLSRAVRRARATERYRPKDAAEEERKEEENEEEAEVWLEQLPLTLLGKELKCS